MADKKNWRRYGDTCIMLMSSLAFFTCKVEKQVEKAHAHMVEKVVEKERLRKFMHTHITSIQ